MRKITPIHGGQLRGTTNAAGRNFGKSARPLRDAGISPSSGRGQRRKLTNVGVTTQRVGKIRA